MRRKEAYWFCIFFIFMFNFSIFSFFHFKGEILYNSFVTERKNVKYTNSYDVTDLSTTYFQLLCKCFYIKVSSVDYQCSVLFWGFTFNTVL